MVGKRVSLSKYNENDTLPIYPLIDILPTNTSQRLGVMYLLLFPFITPTQYESPWSIKLISLVYHILQVILWLIHVNIFENDIYYFYHDPD